MMTALTRKLLSLVGHYQREPGQPAYPGYCICGAPKPQTDRAGRGTPLPTDGRPSELPPQMIQKREEQRFRQ
jgi:hypothetical protein